jgi:hypothetical protein
MLTELWKKVKLGRDGEKWGVREASVQHTFESRPAGHVCVLGNLISVDTKCSFNTSEASMCST